MEYLQTIEQKLDNLQNSFAASKEVLTLDETAIYTGISKCYLYKLTASGQIPHSKPLGKNIFFSRAELQAWLMSRVINTIEAIKSQAVNYVTLKTAKK